MAWYCFSHEPQSQSSIRRNVRSATHSLSSRGRVWPTSHPQLAACPVRRKNLSSVATAVSAASCDTEVQSRRRRPPAYTPPPQGSWRAGVLHQPPPPLAPPYGGCQAGPRPPLCAFSGALLSTRARASQSPCPCHQHTQPLTGSGLGGLPDYPWCARLLMQNHRGVHDSDQIGDVALLASQRSC